MGKNSHYIMDFHSTEGHNNFVIQAKLAGRTKYHRSQTKPLFYGTAQGYEHTRTTSTTTGFAEISGIHLIKDIISLVVVRFNSLHGKSDVSPWRWAPGAAVFYRYFRSNRYRHRMKKCCVKNTLVKLAHNEHDDFERAILPEVYWLFGPNHMDKQTAQCPCHLANDWPSKKKMMERREITKH